MSEGDQSIPKIFISYSHDSPVHNRWVGDLATKLRQNGIDVILDQWDLGLGDDVPKFMEKSVTEADRVLMICTEKYVHKANEGSGGVGYEAMIVTGELVQNLGTSKFIPVIRQGPAQPLVPKSVSTRLYVNLSHEENYQEQLEHLLRELHNAPRILKPPLGQSPFSKGASTTAARSEPPKPLTLGRTVTDVKITFTAALDAIRHDDMIAWRALVREARKPVQEMLAIWRSKYEKKVWTSSRGDTLSTRSDGLMDRAAEGIEPYTSLFGIALGGVVSRNSKFNNQVSILDDVLYSKHWNRSGSTDIVGLPETVAFVYQALHGATCLSTDQLGLAIRLARERVGEGPGGRSSVPLYKTSEIIGWPPTLGGNSKIAWEFLWDLSDRWTWLIEVFGDTDDYRVALCAYYMSLNIIELVDCIADNQTQILEQEHIRFDVPLRTPVMPREIVRRAYRLMITNPDQVRDLWRSKNVHENNVRGIWSKWIEHIKRALQREYMFPDLFMVQERLFDDL
jgi:hypothetical protein